MSVASRARSPRRGAASARRRHRAAHDPGADAGEPQDRQPRQRAGHLRARPDRDHLHGDGRQLLLGRQLQQHHPADGGHHDARLRRRLRPPDRRDRPLHQLHQRRGGRRRRAAPAARELASVPGDHRDPRGAGSGHGDRRVPGVDHRADRRAVVRRHPRGLRDLAGRGPEVDTAGRARDPGPDGQRRLPVLLLGDGRVDPRRDHLPRCTSGERSAACSSGGATASGSAIRSCSASS